MALVDQPDSAFNSKIQRWDYKMEEDQTDIIRVLEEFRRPFQDRLQTAKQQFRAIKVTLIVTIEYKSRKYPTNEPFFMYLRSSMALIYQEAEIDQKINDIYKEIMVRNENFIRNESNLQITNIHYLTIAISRFEPLAASHFTKLPMFLDAKHAIVNVQNRDEKCFAYAILSALYPQRKNPSRAKPYEAFYQREGLDRIKYPVSPAQIPEIEEILKIKINIFSFFDDEGKGRYPLYISKKNDFEKEIDLLYWNEHFAWIKNFSGFIFDLSPAHAVKTFCKRCFGVFLSPETFVRHELVCSRQDFDSILFRFPPEGTKIKFTNIKYQLQASFVLYADFECLLEKNDATAQPKRKRTTLYQKHLPCAAGFYIASNCEEVFASKYESYTGTDVCEWFLNRLYQLAFQLMTLMNEEKRLKMTVDDWDKFNRASACWICCQPFNPQYPAAKVRDHDHVSGKFRGAAHCLCNLQLQQYKKIPVFLHNFRGYDSHLIALATEKFPGITLKIIGQSYEKYLILAFGPYLIFKDSYQFLAYSLEQLACDLRKSGEERFSHLSNQFGGISNEKLELLLRKGVYPYEFMDGWEKLDYPSLPTRNEFYNSLKQEECDPEDYRHAQRVWNEFHCRTMEDYQELYLKTDVLILADVFENFRKFSMEHYRLDPAHYVSSPQLSWDAMLLYTGCVLDLISDPEIFALIDRGIRGGVAMITHRYARANNPEMGTDYRPSEELSYIVYLDANNLYGWAMSQPLPYTGFKWLTKAEWEVIIWGTIPDDNPIGYIIDCDMEYPKELHDMHNDYPLAPERRLIQYEQLNEYQLRILKHYNVPKSSLKVEKLTPHLMARRNYVIHYRNLKFYLEEGLTLKEIHKVLQFTQAPWLAPYIIKNQELRAAAKTDFEKNQPKLYNNAIYGKTCENQKKRSDIKLVNTDKECKRLLEKPQLKGFKIFSERLAAIDLRKVEAKIDKPFYVGFTVLDLSKLHMYKFHYRYIQKRFGLNAKLLFTDTDSLMYHIRGSNPYEQFYKDRAEYFDFASFPKTHKYYDPQNNKIIGKFKDEANGVQITEFVGLRPKMYSYLMTSDKEPKVEKHRAKGIQNAVAKKLKHADFLEQLNNPHENRLTNRRIGSKLHRIYSIKTEKRGLCAFDDKRVLLEDGITTMAYGHYQITGQEMEIGDPENEQRHYLTTQNDLPGSDDEDRNDLRHRTAPASFSAAEARVQKDEDDESFDESDLINDCIGEWDIA